MFDQESHRSTVSRHLHKMSHRLGLIPSRNRGPLVTVAIRWRKIFSYRQLRNRLHNGGPHCSSARTQMAARLSVSRKFMNVIRARHGTVRSTPTEGDLLPLWRVQVFGRSTDKTSRSHTPGVRNKQKVVQNCSSFTPLLEREKNAQK